MNDVDMCMRFNGVSMHYLALTLSSSRWTYLTPFNFLQYKKAIAGITALDYEITEDNAKGLGKGKTKIGE